MFVNVAVGCTQEGALSLLQSLIHKGDHCIVVTREKERAQVWHFLAAHGFAAVKQYAKAEHSVVFPTCFFVHHLASYYSQKDS